MPFHTGVMDGVTEECFPKVIMGDDESSKAPATISTMEEVDGGCSLCHDP